MHGHLYLALLSLCFALEIASLGATANTTYTVPKWHIQSSQIAGDNIAALSTSTYDDSTWHSVKARSTVMAGLIEAGLYNTTELFFSNNLEDAVDISQFSELWYYRYTFSLPEDAGSYHHLQTNGITSGADVYLNGVQLTNSSIQAGAYNGKSYDISDVVVKGDNVLLIAAYPTSYDEDFALGWVDWNPYPPDNGTGVWRDVRVISTGQVMASQLRVITNFTVAGQAPVKTTFKADISNFENATFEGEVKLTIIGPDGDSFEPVSKNITVPAMDTITVSVDTVIKSPQLWWPKAWGEQPLYSVSGIISSSEGEVSDSLAKTNFGIRHITSHVNEHNDTIFAVNGEPFQVIGAGYAPDMFLRFDKGKLEKQFNYMFDMGLNTVRLEGKQEQPELYDLADELGMMVMAGWECCDKWEAWKYNEDVTAPLWDDQDYKTAEGSMLHEAAMMQAHPSMLAFLVGSDYWPNERATPIYVNALRQSMDWQNPIIASASKRGYPDLLGPSGMKMDGPYDWNSPNYWWYGQLGAAFGFGSELGSGVGTPELGSLRKFLSQDDMDDLWQEPDKGLYHMSTNQSSFYDRSIYNQGLWLRHGEPTDLDDYLIKAQMTDYEATKSEFEAYSALWNADRPATGLIYWMLNNAWPSLHWNLFDYYLHPAGSFYGAKAGSRIEHVAYNSVNETTYIVNHSLNITGERSITVDLLDLNGRTLYNHTLDTTTDPNTSKDLKYAPNVTSISDTALLRLILSDATTQKTLSRNIYWLSAQPDVLDFDNSTWYNTPVTAFADFTALNRMAAANVSVSSKESSSARTGYSARTVTLDNQADVPAVFVRLNLVDADGADVTPVYWDDNYVTLWPSEEMELMVEFPEDVGDVSVQVSGRNLGKMRTIKL